MLKRRRGRGGRGGRATDTNPAKLAHAARCAVVIAAVAALQIACTPQDSHSGSQSVAAKRVVVADFRAAPAASRVAIDENTRASVIAAVFDVGAPEDVQVAGTAQGSFTAADTKQILYLLVRGDPVAASPQPRPPLLAVLQDAAVVAQFVPTQASYRKIASTVDIDGDGMEEVLLQADAYHMGTKTSSVHLFGFSGGQGKLVQKYDFVFEDSCDAPLSPGAVRASVLLLDESGEVASQGLKREDYEAACQPGAAMPLAGDYVPKSVPVLAYSVSTTGDAAIVDAFEQHRSGLMVETAGIVDRTLSDDVEGSRHQRFILRLENGHTVLMSHNIDLAARVPVRLGDRVAFRGQYEWNAQGGVVHWTHHDPQAKRPGGWIRLDDQTYR